VSDREIEEILDKAAQSRHEVPAELLKRIADSIEPMMKPVRPLPRTWILTAGMVLIGTAVALLGAARAGFRGVGGLDLSARVMIFGTLAVLGWIAASRVVGERIPGSPHRLGSRGLLAIVSVALLGTFALLFHDYRTLHFTSEGSRCLVTGLLHATPAALLGWWFLRRGWVLDCASAGLAAGVLAGLAGVTMLELHCPNFQALHVLVWHTLVVPVSGALGAIVGWAMHPRVAQG
jgi:hypothetical protein